MPTPTHISIIGGGIGGLTTALCLEHFGFKNYRIYEQADEFREIGAAVSLWPNALQVFRAIGLYDTLKDHWGEIQKAYLKTDKGKVIGTTTPKYDLPLVCIHRAHLHQVLYEHLPQEKLVAGHRLKRYEEQAEGVKLFFENGHTAETGIVIGADGINSVVRSQLIGDGKPVYRGYNCWRGIATLEGTPVGYSSETWGKGSRVGIVPISQNKFGWWATMNEEEGASDGPEGPLAKLQAHFGDWHDPIPHLFTNSPEIMKNRIGDRPPTANWYGDRVVLMGDAAHPTTPNLGQGACMSIEGAFVLAKCLTQVEDRKLAFARYQDLHFKRARMVTKQSLQGGKMGQLENSVAIKARNTMMSALPEKLLMKTLDKYFSYNVTQVEV